MLVIGVFLLLSLYMAACIGRWTIARHYGEKFGPMGLGKLLDSWDHIRMSHRALIWKSIIIIWFVLGIFMTIKGAFS